MWLSRRYVPIQEILLTGKLGGGVAAIHLVMCIKYRAVR